MDTLPTHSHSRMHLSCSSSLREVGDDFILRVSLVQIVKN